MEMEFAVESEFTSIVKGGDRIEHLGELAKDYAIYKGLLKRTEDMKYIPIQFCLFPSPFPKKYFTLIKNIQPILNQVLHKISLDREFLERCFASSSTDEFITQLWNMYKSVSDDGYLQTVTLDIARCDYMLHSDQNNCIVGIKQVENNTMACAMPSLSSHSRDIHSLVLDHLGRREDISKIPINRSAFGIAHGMASAWKLYGNVNSVILFVVEGPTMSNICDHRSLEFGLWQLERDIRVLRHTFTELRDLATVEDDKLFVGSKEVAIVYYRWGYAPHHYDSEDWELRRMMERSKAIKCPTVGYHLAGTKRVQVELARPGVLERFLPEGADPDKIRQVFAKQYLLTMDEAGDEAISLALCNPERYVLKAEREGGGNNLYDNDLVELLHSIGNSTEREDYILMEKINPPPCPTYTVKSPFSPKSMNVTMEIGIYGILLRSKDELHLNKDIGYVVKSKEYGMNEGGLCSGYSFLDSPYLY